MLLVPLVCSFHRSQPLQSCPSETEGGESDGDEHAVAPPSIPSFQESFTLDLAFGLSLSEETSGATIEAPADNEHVSNVNTHVSMSRPYPCSSLHVPLQRPFAYN